jgi:hypothetical protein
VRVPSEFTAAVGLLRSAQMEGVESSLEKKGLGEMQAAERMCGWERR